MKALEKLAKSLLWRIGDHIELQGMFTFGNHVIFYSFNEKGASVEVQNLKTEELLVNVAEYLEQKIMERSISEETIYQVNGFRDEADYLNYKYG